MLLVIVPWQHIFLEAWLALIAAVSFWENIWRCGKQKFQLLFFCCFRAVLVVKWLKWLDWMRFFGQLGIYSGELRDFRNKCLIYFSRNSKLVIFHELPRIWLWTWHSTKSSKSSRELALSNFEQITKILGSKTLSLKVVKFWRIKTK